MKSCLMWSTLYTLYCEGDIKVVTLLLLFVYRFTFGLSTVVYFCEKLFVHLVFADRSVLVDNRLLSTIWYSVYLLIMGVCTLFFRRLFHLYTFFFLLYNSVSGLLTTLRRIFTAFVVTLFFLPRLDCPLVIGGLEFLDKGHSHACFWLHSYFIIFIFIQVTHHIWLTYKWKLLTQTLSWMYSFICWWHRLKSTYQQRPCLHPVMIYLFTVYILNLAFP